MHRLSILLLLSSYFSLHTMENNPEEPRTLPLISLIWKMRDAGNTRPYLSELQNLLQTKNNANEKEKNGTTALMLLCEGKVFPGAAQAVRILLEHGADPKAQDMSDQTALDWLNEMPWSSELSERREIQNAIQNSLKNNE